MRGESTVASELKQSVICDDILVTIPTTSADLRRRSGQRHQASDVLVHSRRAGVRLIVAYEGAFQLAARVLQLHRIP